MDTLLNFDLFIIGYLYASIACILLLFASSLYQCLSCSSLFTPTNDEFHSQVKDLMNSSNAYSIDVGECLEDITANYIVNSTEHYQLPTDIFENTVFEALNDLIDDFAQDPDRFVKTRHIEQIDSIAHAYLNS